jgi:hypothetical protein
VANIPAEQCPYGQQDCPGGAACVCALPRPLTSNPMNRVKDVGIYMDGGCFVRIHVESAEDAKIVRDYIAALVTSQVETAGDVAGPYCPDTSKPCERMCLSICNRRAQKTSDYEPRPNSRFCAMHGNHFAHVCPECPPVTRT